MAVGNTFGATVLSSYGGFWISLAITFIPGGFNIMGALEKADNGEPTMFYNSFALYLFVRYTSLELFGGAERTER
jgi:succinate-acetate transporter protein